MIINESAENYLETILILNRQLPVVREIAEKIYERHEMISSWLIRLGVPKEIALEDACRIGQVISRESFEAIRELIK